MLPPSDHLTLGPFTVYWYSVFLLVAIVLGYLLARPEARRRKVPGHLLQLSLLYGLIPGILGARLYHVIDQWSLYAGGTLEAFAVWNGGLGILGGLAGGALGLWLFARRYQLSLLTLLDIWAPSVLLGQAIGRLGNWTNQEAFGPPTTQPWKIFIDPEYRPEQYAGDQYFHPTFFYEAGLDLIGLAILLLWRPRLRHRPGAVLGAYLLLYATGRFIVEFYRFDTAQVAGVAVAHILAVILICLGIFLLFRPTQQSG